MTHNIDACFNLVNASFILSCSCNLILSLVTDHLYSGLLSQFSNAIQTLVIIKLQPVSEVEQFYTHIRFASI